MSIPIAKKPSGIFFGNHASNVQIDVYIDIQCPHSKLAWPTLESLMNVYQNGEIGLRIHLITLSNHRQSWDVSKAIFAVAGDDDSKFIRCISHFFNCQSEFYNQPFYDKTQADLMDFIVEQAMKFDTNIDKDSIVELINSSEVYDKARTPNRLATIRGAWGTPTFFINNGQPASIKHDSDLNTWKQTIEELLS